MSDRKVTMLGVHPVHPGRGEPSFVELTVVLDYLKGSPIASIVLTPTEALMLLERLAMAIRVTA